KGGCNVQQLGLIPTPLLSYALPRLGLDGGVMVTASHNPPEFNGFKLWAADGASFTKAMVQHVEDIYFASKPAVASWKTCGQLVPADDFRPKYIEALKQQVDLDIIQKQKYKVVADCGGGAASTVVPNLLEAVGVQSELLFCIPDGRFQNRLPEPKAENLTRLISTVKKTNANLGMAWDGDADRIVLVTESGRYLMGDRTFAFATYHRLRNLPTKRKRIVTQVATSDVLHDVASAVGAKLVTTCVGEPNIVSKMKEVDAQIGGEENGGVVYQGWSWTREGMLTALFILELMAQESLTLEQLDMQFPEYFQVKERIACPNSLKTPLMKRISEQVPSDMECELIDGVKLRSPAGWVLLRPSGTEPIFRVFAEAKTKNHAKDLVNKGISMTNDALREVQRSSNHRSE
ncbi:MAG: phosphoglucosamine mutase, partial [Candidatus Hermodarchaeota archaeon]|nr:phosphoglucosamine mutase [Candidatus Hermodarchaeota archaeon]